MKRSTSIMFIFCLLQLKCVFGQTDPLIGYGHLVQRTNPSFFGLNFQNKVGIVFNNASVNQNDRQQANYIFGALSFPEQQFSLGLEVESFKVNITDITYNKARFSFVYHVKINQNLFFLPGVSGKYANNQTISNIILEDQINQLTGFINPESIDPLSSQLASTNYFDLGASFIIHNENFFAGLNLEHLNQPNISQVGEVESKLPLGITLSNAFEINLNPYGQNLFPTNTFLYVYQHFKKFGNTTQLSFNQNLQFNQFTVGFAQNAGKVTTFGLQSFGLTMGLILENFNFGFQYNFPIKSVGNTQSPNILELHLGFDFSPYRRNNRGYHKRIRINNY